MGYRVVWTLKGGIERARVPLDVINEYYVELAIERDAQIAQMTARVYEQERDPQLTLRELNQEERAHRTPRKPVGSDRIDAMMRLAKRR